VKKIYLIISIITVTASNLQFSTHQQSIKYVNSKWSEQENNLLTNQFVTIQDAINNAVDGDTIIVMKGIYSGEGNYNLDFKGKALVIQSEEPENYECIASTIIDPKGVGVVVKFVSAQ